MTRQLLGLTSILGGYTVDSRKILLRFSGMYKSCVVRGAPYDLNLEKQLFYSHKCVEEQFDVQVGTETGSLGQLNDTRGHRDMRSFHGLAHQSYA
jgi:hypothetical protein